MRRPDRAARALTQQPRELQTCILEGPNIQTPHPSAPPPFVGPHPSGPPFWDAHNLALNFYLGLPTRCPWISLPLLLRLLLGRRPLKNPPLPLLTFQNVCTAFPVVCDAFSLFVLCCFSCVLLPRCYFRCFFADLVGAFFPVLLLVGAVGAAVCTTCFCLCGFYLLCFLLFLLLFLFLLLCFSCCLCCFPATFAAGCVLLLWLFYGSPTVEKPTLAAFDLPKCQEQQNNR